jgi:Mce-associated membrane protein
VPSAEEIREIMTDTRDRSGVAPWITAGVLGVLAIALAVALTVFILPNRGKTAGELTSSEKRAVNAAKQELINVLTYSRKTFDADYARALNGATGNLRDDLASKKALTLKALTAGKFDLQGQVTEAAFEQRSGNSTVVLLSATGYTVGADGTPVPKSIDRFELTMTDVKGKWLMSDFRNVGLV